MSTLNPLQPAASAADAAPSRGGLLQILGVGFGLAVIIGNTIGAGILRTPGEVAAQLPNAWMFIGVWVAGGLYALLGAFSISELSAMTPRSGGYYVFMRRALGEFPGFAVGWSDWLAQCGTTAAVSIVIGEYTNVLLKRHAPGYPQLADYQIAIAVTIGMALLQWRGIRWGSLIQNITSAAKALGFLALVVAIFVLASPAPENSPGSLPRGFSLLVALVLAAQAVIYTYDGWYGAIYFGEELRDPGRDAPRSTIWGVYSLMAIYLLVCLALVYALPMSEIAGSKLAVGEAFGAWTITVISALLIVSMLAGINAYHLMASRITFAMSRDALLPRIVARVNPGGTPTTALLLSTVGSVGLTLLPRLRIGEKRPFEDAIAIATFFFVTNYVFAYTAMFVLRRREPDANRPYRAWGYPWTTGLALAGSLAFLVGAIVGDTRNSVYALLVLAASYPLYWLTRRWGRRGG
ncbi:MAG: APC family permease [Terriglobales bacterium]